MHNRFLKTCAAVLLVAASSLVFASNSSAAVIINFIELPNEAGIRVTGTGFDGTPFDVTKSNSESFFVSSPAVPVGYAPDMILSHIGITRTSSGFLFAMLESDGGPVSDYIWVHQFIPAFTVIDFISDSEAALILPGTPTLSVVETGGLQFIGSYVNDRGETVSISAQSDTEVPEPSTIALIGVGLLSLFGFGMKRCRADV